MRTVDYQSVAGIFDAMRHETVEGMTVSDMVGGGYPMPVAVHFAQLLVEHTGLGPGKNILDVGCGCGRIATALTQHIGPQGRYYGIDIVPGLIDFAVRHISERFGNFHFMVLDQKNPAYDAWIKAGTSTVINSISEACPPASIDIGLATSLFTHLDSNMAADMLKHFSQAIKPDGCILLTAFLLDEGTRSVIKRSKAVFTFEHPYGDGVFVEKPEIGLGAAAFELSRFIALLADAGLYIERLLYGNWSGRKETASGQDVLIIRKL